MKIPEDWVLLNTVSHKDIKPFVKECLEVKGLYKTLYIILVFSSIAFLGGIITYTAIRFWRNDESYGLLQFISAFLFSVSALVVIHELIHALAYKLKGANHIYFGANLKKFVFYAASDGDIINGKDFKFVALAPFVVITAVNLVLIGFIPAYKLFFLTIIATHTMFCGGDFAMVNFISQYPLRKIFTFDVRQAKESYFYLSEK